MANLWELSDLATPWSVHVVSTLRIADHVQAGITDIAPLATAPGADRDALHRVLRHLVSKGVFEEPSPGRFARNAPRRPPRETAPPPASNPDSSAGPMAHV